MKSLLLVDAELSCHEKHSEFLHKLIYVIYSYFEVPCASLSASSQTPASPSVAEALLAGKGGVVHSLQYYFLAHHFSLTFSHFTNLFVPCSMPFESELRLQSKYGIEINLK